MPWWQVVGLAGLAALTVALCYLAVTRDTTVTDTSSGVDTTSTSTLEPEPGDESSPTLTKADLPEVPDQRRTDFTEGDGLPDGSRVYDSGGNRSGMRVRDGLLVHGAPTDAEAQGLVETRLEGEVTSLGVRVRFADQDSGSAVLAAWQASVTEAADASRPLPSSGLLLVASPGEWRLTVRDDAEDVEEVLADGTYRAKRRPATFRLLRQGTQVFVVDPTGAVTSVSDPRAAGLAGPWATWGLLEQEPSMTPAAIEAVWAG